MGSTVCLRVRDRVGVGRRGAPVVVGVPFGTGALVDEEQLSLAQDGRPLPCQARALSRWPDGSLRWALVSFLLDVPERSEVEVELEIESAPGARPAPPKSVSLEDDGQRIRVDNGMLSFSVDRRRFRLLDSLALEGESVLRGADCLAQKEGSPTAASSSHGSPRRVMIEEHGPLRAALLVEGSLCWADERPLLDYWARFIIYAGAPFVQLEYSVVNAGADLEERPDPRGEGAIVSGDLNKWSYTPLRRLGIEFRADLPDCGLGYFGGDSVRNFIYEVHPPASIALAEDGGARLWQSAGRGGATTWAVGHGEDGHGWVNVTDMSGPYAYAPRPLHRRHEDGSETIQLPSFIRGWAHLSNGRLGVTVQVRHFKENRPKKVVLEPDRVVLDLWPAEADVLELAEGAGKTHELTVTALRGDPRAARVDEVAAALSEPLIARLPAEYVQSTGAVGDLFPPDPRYPALEMALRVGYRQCKRSVEGLMHFGDDGSAERRFWMNNQYDWQYGLFLYFLRTGLEEVFLDAEAATWHSMDVDTIKHSRNPLWLGGQHDGRADHTALPPDPSQQFVQGILMHYRLTGHPKALEIARGLGRNAVRQLRDSGMVFNNGRCAGWNLLILVAVYEETHDPELKSAIDEMLDRIEAWQGPDGDFSHRISNAHAYYKKASSFFSAILLSALYRAYEATGDERARRLFLRGVDFLVDRASLPHGVIAGDQSPGGEVFFNVGTSYSMHPITQSLAWATKLTGDRRYLEQAVKFWQFQIRYEGGLKVVADVRMHFWCIFRFLHQAAEAGLLEGVGE